jgi:hypothetical protein
LYRTKKRGGKIRKIKDMEREVAELHANMKLIISFITNTG